MSTYEGETDTAAEPRAPKPGGMRRALTIGLPVVVLAVSALGARFMLDSPPEAHSRPSGPVRPAVDATRLQPQAYPVFIDSQGTVRPARQTTLVSEVNGRVSALAPSFERGQRFSKGATLVQVDKKTYEIALTQAEANLAQAVAALAEQRALAEQARADWKSLGRGGKPSSLTLREPQLAAAEASRSAAEAQLEQARLDLARTTIEAPYDGVVLERQIDEGQFVARGASLGRIHASSAVEVSLPLTNRQLTWVSLPGQGHALGDALNESEVVLSSGSGSRAYQWAGKLARVEGVDSATQQLRVVARVREPLAGEHPLRVGQFVQARVAGQVLQDVFVVPRSALRDNDQVLLLNDQQEIARHAVEVIWSDDENVIIGAGLARGQVLVLTPLATVVDGTPVRATIDGEPPAPLEEPPGRRPGKLPAVAG